MKLNEAIINIRVELQKRDLKKSGKNAFAGFTYFELSDFLPTLNELMAQKGVNDTFSIDGDTATLTLIKGDEREEYTIPYHLYATPLNKNGSPSMQDVQYFGAILTYYKRYIYMNAFGITDGEVIDAMEKPTTPTPAPQKAENSDDRKMWVKFNEDLKHEDIDLNEFIEFYKIKMTQKVKLKKFVEEFTTDSDVRNKLVIDYKTSLEK